MIIKRILAAAALAACVACAVISCGVGEWGETLRWKSAVDIPVNHGKKVGWGLDSSLYGGGVLLDLGADTFSTTSDAMDVVKKMTDQKFSYRISITNQTSVRLTLYGLLFRDNDGAATMDLLDFYGIATASAPIGDRINLMGTGGLAIEPNATERQEMPASQERPLCDLVLDHDAISWRWLAKVEASKADSLRDTASTTDSISMRLMIRVAGVNSFDSLFSLNKPQDSKKALLSLRNGALP
ncbi:MAG: hypothetical protein LBH93_07670 [Chitinispirillales bacterium]|jgi:hypothetical protein|nr:hypothetical protein [Chitinispirillales bacterium]